MEQLAGGAESRGPAARDTQHGRFLLHGVAVPTVLSVVDEFVVRGIITGLEPGNYTALAFRSLRTTGMHRKVPAVVQSLCVRYGC